MGRPVDQAKRLEIAVAALEVLRERGIGATRMSHVADALGMKRPTLYHYFGSIPELFEFAVARLREAEIAHVAASLQGVEHPLDALVVLLESTLAFYQSRGIEEFVFLICQGWAVGDASTRDRFGVAAMQYLQPLRQLLIGSVASGVQEGRIRECEPGEVVDAALSVLHGAIVHEVLVGVPATASLEFFTTHVLEPLRASERA